MIKIVRVRCVICYKIPSGTLTTRLIQGVVIQTPAAMDTWRKSEKPSQMKGTLDCYGKYHMRSDTNA